MNETHRKLLIIETDEINSHSDYSEVVKKKFYYYPYESFDCYCLVLV